MAEPRDQFDASSEYQLHAQRQESDAIFDAIRQRVLSRQAPAAPGAAPAAAPGTPAPAAPIQGGDAGAIQLPEIVVNSDGSEPVRPEGPGVVGTFIDYAKRAGIDITKGVMVEGPGAAVAGAYDGIYNVASGAANGLNALAEWLNTNVADLKIGEPDKVGLDPNASFMQRLAANPISALFNAMPAKTEGEETVTGHLIRDTSKFMLGFIPAVRAMGGLSPATAIAAGGIADFTTKGPDDNGFADLLGKHPALKPYLSPLMTKPDDSELLNRAKHGLEGLGMGLLAEGAIRAVRALAHMKKASPEIEAQKMLYGDGIPRDMLMVSDESAPLSLVARADAKPSGDPLDKLAKSTLATETGVPDQVAAKGVAMSAEEAQAKGLTRIVGEANEPVSRGTAGAGPDVFVNFGRINAPEDVQQVIRDMADAFKGDVNAARRGVQTNEETAKLASQLGMTVEDLLTRTKGQPLNAEQSLAARRLLNTSAAKVVELSQAAASPNASLSDMYNFRRMLSIHHAIQSEVIAARTETARALQSWSIPAGGGNMEMARNVQLLMETMGGQPVTAELAKRMALLQSQGLPEGALANMARRGWGATTVDAAKEAFVMGLLWSPSTHIVNNASNLVVSFLNVVERGTAARIGDALGSGVGERVADGEALAMAYGMITSLHDAIRLGARAARTGETGVSLGSKVDMPVRAIGSQPVAREMGKSAAEAAAFADTAMGRGLDFIGAVNGVPGRVLAASDEFAKTIAYRGEVHAQALRQATSEGATGAKLWQRMAEISNNPPEHIRLAAADAALLSTFQNRTGDWGRAVMGLRDSGSYNPTFLVLPFVKTPMNILRYSFEHSPIAPLVGQWREDIAAGGARAHLAMARMAVGTTIMATGMDLASSGIITGPGPVEPGKREALERTGWQPWSVYVGGKYYSYSRTDPIGMLLGLAGTVSELSKASEIAPEDYDQMGEIIAEGIGVISQSVVDKTYFRGILEVLTMFKGAESGEGGVLRFLDTKSGAFAFNTLLNTVKRGVDPVQREVNSSPLAMDGYDAIMAKIPGLSSKLTPSRNLWGEERRPDEVYGRAYDMLSPIPVREKKVSPIDDELVRNNSGVKRIGKKTGFDGVRVNFREYPQVYDEYVRLAGNELKDPGWGLGAKDFLNAVVSGQHPMSAVYNIKSDGAEGEKVAFIKNTIEQYRKLAQAQIMATAQDRYPEFYQVVTKAKAEQAARKMPVFDNPGPGAAKAIQR